MPKDIQKNILKKEKVYGRIVIYKIYMISTKYESAEMVEQSDK